MPKRLIMMGVVVITLAALIIYHPALLVGFYLDDWGYIELLGRLGVGKFLLNSIDPGNPDFLNTFRPLQGLLFAVEYLAWANNANGYHLVHMLLHAVNALLLWLIVWELAHRSRIAFLSGLFYASLPVYSVSVFLISATDVLATLFYLVAVYCWIKYLQLGARRWFFCMTGAFLLGLLGKELVVTLPAVLCLIEFFFFRRSRPLAQWVRRYAVVVLMAVGFIMFELGIYSTTQNYRAYGTSLGWHVLTNFVMYGVNLLFPWHTADSEHGWWAAGFLIVSVLALARKHAAIFGLTSLWAGLNILPVLGFQRMFSLRYLYLSGVAPATWLAVLFDLMARLLKRGRYSFLSMAAASVLIIFNAMGVAAWAQEYAEDSRAQRVPFRDIARANPSFPDGTYLFFIDPPISLRELSGMLYLRYGEKVSTGEPINGYKAQLREHNNPIIYYFDATGKPIQVSVQPDGITQTLPRLPATFEEAIRLEDYELSGNLLEPGKPLVLLLYWRATQKLAQDYTVFVHLIDADGRTVASIDSQPAAGKAPTSSWQEDLIIVDSIILPIPQDLMQPGDYHLKVGLYFLPTMQTLSVIEPGGARLADHIRIEPFQNR